MTTTTLAKAIYDHLDAFTGGIEMFLAETTDETYESDVYEPFHITALGGRYVTFGFFTEMNGDLCPDPEISVTLGNGEALLDSLSVQTFLGNLYQGGDGGNAGYCSEFLEMAVERKKNGTMKMTNRVTYPD